MKISKLIIIAVIVLTVFSQCKSQKKNNKETIVEIETTMGNLKVKLYDETPEHKNNFLKLIDEKFYEGVLFHRVIADFMIQAGDPDSKTAQEGQALGSGGPGYTIPAEFNPKFIHKKGALSAARTGDQVNPEKRSSGSQFYIVQGSIFNDEQLTQMETQSEMNQLLPFIRTYIQNPENESIQKEIANFQNTRNEKGLDSLINIITEIVKKEHPEIKSLKYTEEQKNIYKTIGGTPHLDGAYTVFGEVVEGLDIIDKIASVKRDKNDRPIDDIKIISMKIIK
ncbi:MAG: peptidylprolyl isomerase [Bacteroidales bacterium]|nr:peptidylprolyl isomerase [Bacteroidales bacterium]MBN2756937.1 peptidylprolyl isomerase [Bacteroidales bacterium]